MKRINVVSCQVVKERTLSYDFKTVRSPRDCAEIISNFIGSADRENLVVACLDSKNNINALHTVSVGSLNASIVHPREVFKAAILANACSIIVGHNHPSGDTTPSQEDIQITKQLVEAGKILGIQVLDHVIIGDDGDYRSLKEENMGGL